MYDRLNELGIPAVLTRDSDITLTRNERLSNALNAFGANDNVILVSNHINSGGGEFTYHYIIWLSIKTAVFEWFIYIV